MTTTRKTTNNRCARCNARLRQGNKNTWCAPCQDRRYRFPEDAKRQVGKLS